MYQKIRKRTDLNGIWRFCCAGDETTIRVPSSYSSPEGQRMWNAFPFPEAWRNQDAEYSRTIDVTAEMLNAHILFVCEGCLFHSHLYVNGQKVGESHQGSYPFSFSIGNYLHEGENTLTLAVEAAPSLTYSGDNNNWRGIWKDVYLLCVSDLSAEKTYVETSVSKGTLTYHTTLVNRAAHAAAAEVRARVLDRDGKEVLSFPWQTVAVDGGETLIIGDTRAWENPHLWFTHDPYLYHLEIQIAAPGRMQLLDADTIRFGFREITVNGPHLYLNGKELYLRGNGDHYVGALMNTKEYAVHFIQGLKEAGLNFMRMHTCPRHKSLYEAADELGFLIEAEAENFFKVPEDPSVWKDNMTRMIEDSRNHPSVIIWSVSNELRWNGGGEHPELVEFAKTLDSTRPIFSSDFSGWSLCGDAIGHHYNAASVFDEWEEFGPDKPMVWDELGNVWQHNRPLHNASAGYEVTSQDYATGLWRDGNEIRSDIAQMTQGKVFGGELHRVNAYIPWDYFDLFYRYQPLNWHRGIEPQYDTLEGPGVKPMQYPSCSSPLNLWDPCLPELEPNPGYYVFERYLKPIRFLSSPDQYYQTQWVCFGDSVITRTETLFYEDLRDADSMVCRLEARDGTVLSEQTLPISVQAGQMIHGVESRFVIPRVREITDAYLVREFFLDGVPGARWQEEITVFPQPSEYKDAFSAFRIGVSQEEPALRAALTALGCICTEPEDADVLVTERDSDALRTRISAGARVLLLEKGIRPDGVTPSPRLLLNGPEHRILRGLGAESFIFAEDLLHGVLECDPTAGQRTVLAGDKDAVYAAITEQYPGRGACIATSLRLLQTCTSTPASAVLLLNILSWLSEYEPTQGAATLLLAGEEWRTYLDATGLVCEAFSWEALDTAGCVIADSTAPAFASFAQDARTKRYLQSGGQILFLGADENSIPALRSLTEQPLAVREPYLGVRTPCIKAAVSWTRRDTPKRYVQYYDKLLIPQPFEANYDPLLLGISNHDLAFQRPMFDCGIEIEGMNAVFASPAYSILAAAHRIDWSQPKYGGEYIHLSKDIRRADWFLNRSPILFSVRVGAGNAIFCQIKLPALDDGTGRHLALGAKLLCNLHCTLAGDCRMPEDGAVCDLSVRREQYERFTRHMPKGKVCRRGPTETAVSLGTVLELPEKPHVLLLGGEISKWMVRFAGEKLSDTLEVHHFTKPSLSTAWLSANYRGNLGDEPRHICFFPGQEDLMNYEGLNPPREYNRDLELSYLKSLFETIEATGSKLIVCTMPEFDHPGCEAFNANVRWRNEQIRLLAEKMPNAYLVDTASYECAKKAIIYFLTEHYDEEAWTEYGSLVADAILFFGG